MVSNLKNKKKSYRYQDYNIGRTQASRFVQFAENIFKKFDIEEINKQLLVFLNQINNNRLDALDEILNFIEADIKRCKQINGFCFHEITTIQFITNKLIQLLRLNQHAALNKKLNGLKRILVIYDYYHPFFKENEKATLLLAKNSDELSVKKEIRSKYVADFVSYVYNQSICLNTKISMAIQLINDFSLSQDHKELENILIQTERAISLNPYINKSNNYLITKILYLHYAYLNQAKKMMLFYLDTKKTGNVIHPNETFISKLSVALDMFDVNFATQIIGSVKENDLTLNIDYYPFISRYYFLMNDIDSAYSYIQKVVSQKSYTTQSMIFDVLWSTYFMILFEQKEFQLIVTEFEQLIFKKKFTKAKNEGFACLDIKLIYIASKYKLGLTRTDSFYAQTRGIFNILQDKYFDLINQLKIRKALEIIEKQVEFNKRTKKEINKIYDNTQILIDIINS